jgi:hypothetical protein
MGTRGGETRWGLDGMDHGWVCVCKIGEGDKRGREELRWERIAMGELIAASEESARRG